MLDIDMRLVTKQMVQDLLFRNCGYEDRRVSEARLSAFLFEYTKNATRSPEELLQAQLDSNPNYVQDRLLVPTK